MNTAVPMVWRMGPKYGLQESSPPPGGLVGPDWGSGRASSTCRCAGSGTGRRRAACSRCPASTLSWSVMIVPAAIADGASARPASMLAVAQTIAVTIIGMRRVVWLSLIPVFSFPVCTSCRLIGCGMVGVQRVESGDFHRGWPVFAWLQTELAYLLRRTADGNGCFRFLRRCHGRSQRPHGGIGMHGGHAC